MPFLYFLESIRAPFLDSFFSVVTMLGEETFFILFGLVFFWCIDKKQGYYLLSVGFIGLAVNQFLKMFFRVPRPWVKDQNFTIVESARAEATGYSFPSGHTQASVGAFGAVARWNSNKILRTICITFCVLVPLSRLYLGVHTLLDVGVSIIIALLLIFGLYPVLSKCFENKKTMRILFSTMVALSLGLLAFLYLYNFPADLDQHNYASAMKYGYTMLGCTAGIFIVFEIDERFIRFDTSGTLGAQIIKVVLGIIPLLLIKEGLKAPLLAVFNGSVIADGLRYFIIVLYLGCIWPLTFKWFSKLFRR